MRMLDVIDAKRNGKVLSDEQIQYFVDGVVDNSIPDYQISALLMAIYFQGMEASEQTKLTMAMLESGDQLDLSAIDGIKVDKHSTGGVGDKTSLPLAAMVAATGIPVPMISGRGLGHTGGTLDKLEAIPGFRVSLTEKEFIDQVKEIGLAIVGATGQIAPADARIYGLRDVTDTVDSIPLIASSILSKKLASGTDALVIDVKTGAGAFMKVEADAQKLAHALVEIANGAGVNSMAIISDMNQPLGEKIGNSLEIEESIDILKGKGPQDLMELILTLGSQMVVLGKKADTLDEARELLKQTVTDGSALKKFTQMIEMQGGDTAVIDHPEIMPQAKYHIDIKAQSDGYVTQITADEMGIASMQLGGGRAAKEDQLDYSVGLVLHHKIGDKIKRGDSLVTVYSNQEDISRVEQLIRANFIIGAQVTAPELIHEIITD
ncbi:pyrimidine nucleoside phosphorylase [Paucilactobacillus hokkaidonensis JCM 18461]|uniref:Pyrimidine-nucleoside phosphorylase n=2 Tax=Paucilactobacillus hokkaidonensis TaxID=1193095 RepID=A0A0A1GZI1_9LACO|nr:pyrimidine-nucleoside phosphorylase [Paucilactobacillus hokkaidonensis]KRO07691.1 pyrimidine-nucleoside phosphorylase [Paucilactobacillus hokkaidonensis]BAP86404.1 pyrimidine nucleoside phosphorylase [Paucilactobacillus hokkaidonensis JCM 18461]